MVRVCKEESFHQRQGFDIMLALCRGTAQQKQMAQDALNRWWWPSVMMFGPSDAESVHSAQSSAWKIKILSNDELRQRYNMTLTQLLSDPAVSASPVDAELDASDAGRGRLRDERHIVT